MNKALLLALTTVAIALAARDTIVLQQGDWYNGAVDHYITEGTVYQKTSADSIGKVNFCGG